MRNRMISDQQYQALVGRSGVLPRASSQFVPPQSDQYLSRKLYDDRVAPPDPYRPAVGSSVDRPALPYAAPNRRADNFPDSQDMQAQLAVERHLVAESQLVAERRGTVLQSPPLADYSPPPYRDHIGPRGLLSGSPISPEVIGSAYWGRFPSPQRAGQPLSNAELELAARARRLESGTPYPGVGYGHDLRRIPPALPAYDEPGGFRGQAAAGILGPGGSRRGTDMDRYLSQVQPEKLFRYVASVLAPDPALKRSSYPIVGNNLNPEDDPYSHHRRAKARRIVSHEFGGGGEPGSHKDRERDIHRERRGRGELFRERGKRSPDRRQTNGSSSKGKNDSNRVDCVNNTSQSSEGRRGQQNGGQNKRSRPPENSGKQERGDKPREKAETDLKSDNDSELGTLCADLSNSDGGKVEKKSEEAATVIDGPLAGMIFGCSSVTFHECMRLQLFGLPSKSKDDVMRVTPGTKVFLFNFDTKELSGIFEAVSHGGWQIQPEAFRDFGGFPAQVQVCVSEQCPNIPQSVFKPAIRENYVNQTRFRFDLNTKQVRDLVRMFRQARQATRNHPRQPDPLADRYLSARLLSEDYLARGGQQQIPYPRHPQACFGTSSVPYERVISMSTKTSGRKSKRASKRSSRGRKKRKVYNRPQSPMADNCSLYSVSGEIQEANVALNASGCDDTSNTTTAVIVLKGIETGNFRNVDQHRAIGETPAAKGIAPSGPHRGLSPSQPEEVPQLQSDLGKQVSFLKDSYNDGTFRLAGSRADEQGQGLGLDERQGALSSRNVIKASDSTVSSMGEGLFSEVRRDLSTTNPAVPLVNLEGNVVQQLASSTDGDGQLSELDGKRNRESLGDIGFTALDCRHADLDTCESVSIEFGTGGMLPGVEGDEVFVQIVEDEADWKLPIVGKNEELEVIATQVDTFPEAPCVKEEVVVAAGVVRKNEELVVIAAEVAIGSGAPCVREEVVIAPGVVDKDEELEVTAAKAAIDSDSPFVTEEVMIAFEVVGKDKEFEVIAAAVAIASEALCVGEQVAIVAGSDIKDELLEVIGPEVAIAFDASCVSEEAMTAAGAAGAAGKDEELQVSADKVAVYSETVKEREEVHIAAEVAVCSETVSVRDKLEIANEVVVYSETVSVREEVLVSAGPISKHEELEVISAGVAIDSEAPCVREEMTVATDAVGKHEELEVTSAEVAIDSDLRQDIVIAAGAVGKDEEFDVTSAKVALDCNVEQEVVIAAGAVGKDKELEVVASEVALDSEAPLDKEDVLIATVVHIDFDGCFDKEEVMFAAGAVGKDDDLDVDCEAALDQEEVMIAAGTGAKNKGLEIIAVELTTDSECVREEVMIAAQRLSSQLLASADTDDKVTVHDDVDQGEEVLAADSVGSEQRSTDLKGSHEDEEREEEEVLLTDKVLGCEFVTSADEDENEVAEEQDHDYDEGDDESENEETVDISVDCELSNVGQDGDEDEEIAEGVEDEEIAEGVEDDEKEEGVEDEEIAEGVEDDEIGEGVEDEEIAEGVEDDEIGEGVEDDEVGVGVEDDNSWDDSNE